MHSGWGVMHTSDTQEGLDLNPCHQFLSERPQDSTSYGEQLQEANFSGNNKGICICICAATSVQSRTGKGGFKHENFCPLTSTSGTQHEAG